MTDKQNPIEHLNEVMSDLNKEIDRLMKTINDHFEGKHNHKPKVAQDSPKSIMKLEELFTLNGYTCAIRRVPFVMPPHMEGHLCGYVQVPETHPFYGKKYEEVDGFFDVHGGLTFSDRLHRDDKNPESYPGFWLGFDCGHYGDDPQVQNIGYVMHELLHMTEVLNSTKRTTTPPQDIL